MDARSFGFHVAQFNRSRKSIKFEQGDVPKELPLAPGGYWAERIAIKNFGHHLGQARGKMTRIELAQVTGMYRKTITNVERNTSPVPASAATLYRGIGGLGLYLAFSPKQDARRTNEILLASPYDQAAIKDWFRVSYREAGLRRPGVCELVGVTVDSLREFMEANNSGAATLAKYIQPVTGLRVDFCGIRALPENSLKLL